MRLPLAVVLAASAILGVAASAGASVTTADLAAVLPVAQAAWPDSACRGIENVHLNADEAMSAQYPGLVSGEGNHIAAMASKATCEVWVASTVANRADLCTALTHEFGHLALTGTDADHDRGGIMMVLSYRPCEDRFGNGPHTPRAWAESVFPKGTRCTFAKTRGRRRIYRCSHGWRAIVRLTASGRVAGVTGVTRRNIITLNA